MTTLTWFLAITCTLQLSMVLGLLHVRLTRQQTEVAFDHAKLGRSIKQAFVTCKSWFHRKSRGNESDEMHDDYLSDKIHSMRA